MYLKHYQYDIPSILIELVKTNLNSIENYIHTVKLYMNYIHTNKSAKLVFYIKYFFLPLIKY